MGAEMNKSKQEVFDELQKEHPTSIPVFKAMDAWARQVSIAFLEYHEKFRREEGRWWQQQYKKAGGMMSWVGRDVNKVYDDFIAKKPIQSYLIPEVESFWQYNDKGKLVHSLDK